MSGDEPSWNDAQTTFDDKIEFIRDCLRRCRSQHASNMCRPTPCRPLRLINVGLDGTTPRLFQRHRQLRTYAALSHCWGTRQLPSQTTRSNVHQLSRSIPPDILPKTFANALEIARRLQIPYLWIDALCIVQDDNQEWQDEAARMDAIYLGSQLTIAATESRDSSQGCFPFKENGGFEDGEIFFRANIPPDVHSPETGFLVRVYKNDIRRRHEESVLSTRGWTLQKQLLSPRFVSCMSPDVHWVCRVQHRIQCRVSIMVFHTFGHVGLRFSQLATRLITSPRPKEVRLARHMFHDSWRRMVNDYADREFTYASDRVAAIRGAIRYMHRLLNDDDNEPILGLWRKSFALGLAWMRISHRQDRSIRPLDAVHNLPSWTWLACPGQAIYHHWKWEGLESISGEELYKRTQIILLDYRIKWTSAAYTSTLLYAYVRVECPPIREIEITPFSPGDQHNPPYFHVFGENLSYPGGGSEQTTIPWRCAGQFDAGNMTKGGRYPCMLVKVGFLILEADHNAECKDESGSKLDDKSEGPLRARRRRKRIPEMFLILEKVEHDGTHDFGGLVSREENHDEILVYKRIGIAHLQSEEGQEVFDTASEKRISVILV
ncbi:heterokaryon incompatibility protein-domain-containing protein [Rhypophila decipiens]|uniref:Heterokaryon incompatibility protein-domain-containing protein n=1 Tax=Rhypophila decipiens TaxID=261697 RepID=A0AAN6Y5A3_9PEZI|nr:heterokaryon incompatibility protein-domain-containing protein [Rhypophila decipiens]